jgi:hypothetical protein
MRDADPMTASLLEDDEAERIAGDLAAKYGEDAISYVRARADRAQEVGDELAWNAWQAVLDATETLLSRHEAE